MADVMQSKVFKQRSASILKKARELSILCDIRVCALIVDPNGKEILTYPENHGDAIHLLKQFTTKKNTMNTMAMKKKKKKEKKLDFCFEDKLIEGLSKESVIEISKMLNSKIEEARNRVQFLKKKKEQEKQQQQQQQSAPVGFLINPTTPNFDYEMMMFDFSPISGVPDYLTYCGEEQLGYGGGGGGGGGIDLVNELNFSKFDPEVVMDLPPPLSYLPGVDDSDCCCSSSSSIMAAPQYNNYFGSECGSTYTFSRNEWSIL